MREENPEFREGWNTFQDTFIKALDDPGKWHAATNYVSFAYVKSAPYPRMLMRLPSGRAIVYPLPEKSPITMVRVKSPCSLEEEEEGFEYSWKRLQGHRSEEGIRVTPGRSIENLFHTWELTFEGHVKGAVYGRVKTYGGDLLQSCWSQHTKVITPYGLKSISQVRPGEFLWDGQEFVPCGGSISRGFRKTEEKFGLRATPDHKVLVDNYWVDWSSVTQDEIERELTRSRRTFGESYSGAAHHRAKMGTQMRLWRENNSRHPFRQINHQKRGRPFLFPKLPEEWVPSKTPLATARTFGTKSGQYEGGEETLFAWASQMAAKMRLWRGAYHVKFRSDEVSSSLQDRVLQSQMSSQRNGGPHSRLKHSPHIPYSRLNDGSMLPRVERKFQALRGSRHNCLQAVAQSGDFFQGHAPDVRTGTSDRPKEQQRKLHSEKLSLGHPRDPERKQTKHYIRRFPVGENPFSDCCEESESALQHFAQPSSTRLVRRRSVHPSRCEEVFDILNCGPRNRFAVAAPEGGYLIAHNCTQGTGVDLLAHGVVEAEKAGFNPFFLVHDQCLTPAQGDKDKLTRALCKVPEWFPGFPLEAETDEVRSYCKS